MQLISFSIGLGGQFLFLHHAALDLQLLRINDALHVGDRLANLIGSRFRQFLYELLSYRPFYVDVLLHIFLVQERDVNVREKPAQFAHQIRSGSRHSP